MTSSRPTKLSSPEVGDKTSEKPELDAWRKKSSLLQSEVKIVISVKLKAKKGQFVAGTLQNCIFPQDCDFENSDISQDLHERDDVLDDLLREVLLQVS